MSQIKHVKGSKWIHSTLKTLLQKNFEVPHICYIQDYTQLPSVKTSLQDDRLHKSSEQYNIVSYFAK